MGYTMNQKQIAQLSNGFASETLHQDYEFLIQENYAVNGYRRSQVFHSTFNMTVGYDWSQIPTVSERILRGKLLIEEVLETFEAMGLCLVHECNGGEYSQRINHRALEYGELRVVHIEGSVYDPIEVADGLADIKVITNGTAVAFGIPMDAVDVEVFASNMTKVGKDGKPIVNQEWACSYCNETGTVYIGHEYEPTACESCDGNGFTLTDPAQPVGKLLKPDTYVKANIARLYVQHTKENQS